MPRTKEEYVKLCDRELTRSTQLYLLFLSLCFISSSPRYVFFLMTMSFFFLLCCNTYLCIYSTVSFFLLMHILMLPMCWWYSSFFFCLLSFMCLSVGFFSFGQTKNKNIQTYTRNKKEMTDKFQFTCLMVMIKDEYISIFQTTDFI